jgi:hypothetical protein
MSGYSNIILPCGHRAAYRDTDPAEGVYTNHCEWACQPPCDWREGVVNRYTRAHAREQQMLAVLKAEIAGE